MEEVRLNEKILAMDYEYIESADIQNKRRTLQDISNNNNNNGGGIITVFYSILELFTNTIGLICSIALMITAVTVGFHTATGKSRLFLLFASIILLVILLLIVGIIVRSTARSKNRQYNITKNFYGVNRLGYYYIGEYLTKHEAGKDIRMFNQYPLLKKSYDEYSGEIMGAASRLKKSDRNRFRRSPRAWQMHKRKRDVLPKRFVKYGLKMNETKTKARRFTPPGNGNKPDTFQFLGFMHYWGKSRKGNWVVKRKTDRSRLTRSLKAVSAWCRKHRHDPIPAQNNMLNLKLKGHYNYYGITPSSENIRFFLENVQRIWMKWLNRRSRNPHLNWITFNLLLQRYPLAVPRICHSFV